MEDKKLADYLHLYLGCRLERGGIVTTALLDAAKLSAWDAWQDFKPILRPLSDIQEDELEALAHIDSWYIFSDKEDAIGTARNILKDCEFKPDAMLYLLSKHFDLFGLIESGIAINKNNQASI